MVLFTNDKMRKYCKYMRSTEHYHFMESIFGIIYLPLM